MKGKRQVRGLTPFAEITETETWLKLAELVETKGHMVADPQYYKSDKYFHPLIVVEMSTEQDAYEMAKRFGFSSQVDKSGRWTISRKLEVQAFLKKVIPHLQTKQKQAEIAFEMANVLIDKPERWMEKTTHLAEQLKRAC